MMATILDHLRAVAQRRNWTPAQLAREADISYTSAYRILKGASWRGEETLAAAMRALGLQVTENTTAPGVQTPRP